MKLLKLLTEASYGGRTPDVFVLFDLRTRKYLSGLMYGPDYDDKDIKIFSTHEEATEYLNKNRKQLSDDLSNCRQTRPHEKAHHQKALAQMQSVKVVRLTGQVV